MESLHAPWRIEYILRSRHERGDGSVFAALAQSDDDEGNHVVARSRSSFAVLNTHPYNGGHVLVMPYREVPDLDDLDDGELLDLWKLVRRCKQALAETMDPDGFNIGINLGRVAGAGIEEHLHIHIVPRWRGDTNFMPAIAQTAVLPEALTETASKLRTAMSD